MTISVDVLGIGLNATDTLILLSEFPPYAGKVAFDRELLSPGGQVATAIVACAKLGARSKYIGTIGDDLRGRVQRESLEGTGVDTSGLIMREGCPNQTAYILIDQRTGERTVLWQRDSSLRLLPQEIRRADVASCRMLHIDGYDTEAAAFAASVAREIGIPVSLDVDTIYPKFEPVLRNVDILVASSVWPGRWTGETDPFVALALLQREYGMRIAAMTLGEHGSLALSGGTYTYSPAFRVHTVDTTGAGDVFHGALCVAMLAEMPMQEALDFSNAAAALNCTAIGARGHIASRAEVEALLASSAAQSENRRTDPEIAERCGTRIAVANSSATHR
ncbi:MAG TPA: PfkB family carbohydrate kinase [Bryobacteraceae bacterium]|nr:PfkB family carbohydrate kinase [Bryobacteraceae bacterium]